jgi:hypothetical protein
MLQSKGLFSLHGSHKVNLTAEDKEPPEEEASLHLFCGLGDIEAISRLLNKRVNVDETDEDRQTALLVACSSRASSPGLVNNSRFCLHVTQNQRCQMGYQDQLPPSEIIFTVIQTLVIRVEVSNKASNVGNNIID